MINKIIFGYLILVTLVIADDYTSQRGMTNLLGVDTNLRCAQQMSNPKAKTYELSYKRTASMPLSPFAGEYKPKFLPEIPWAGSRQVFTMDVLNENVNDGNQGTQMDALGHFGYTDEVWNGDGEADLSSLKYFGELIGKEVKPTPGSPLKKLGIESVPPIITTAVFLDVRKHIFNGKAMKAGEYVTVQHIKDTIKKSNVKDRGILPGDVVLINTGWSDNYQDPDDLGIYYTKAPGVSYNLVKYLSDKQVVGVGLDTWGVDTFAEDGEYGPERSQNPEGIANPAHHYFLTQSGVHTLENFNLKDLAKDSVDLSCVIILPLMTQGSSASPLRPVAIGVPTT
ncbi:MAG: cyclase family protein [Gammaproteobacteria bacterium]|tara:strand:- start:76 stop:1092 length:1017 start_codon:yes stop_codon:yes gene_type:complete